MTLDGNLGQVSTRDARLAEAQELSAMLVAVTERAKADFAAISSLHGLPVHLARAVVRLSSPAPMRELADDLACDRSYITSLADQLESRGLVERVPGSDRRVKLLQLTAEGVRVRDGIAHDVADQALVLRRLTDEQRRELRPLLLALLDGEPVASC